MKTNTLSSRAESRDLSKHSEADRIFNVIKHHVGAENAIGARGIALELGKLPSFEREIRRIIAENRDAWPEIVCAKLDCGAGEGGYFVPETHDEITAYWAWLDDLRSKAEEKVHRFEQLCRKHGINIKFEGYEQARQN